MTARLHTSPALGRMSEGAGGGALCRVDGAPWKFGREITGYRSYWPDSGHGRLTVRPNLATVEFVSQQGRVFHRFAVEPG